jgi:Fur family peroxide stress response transcriptional regulator
VISIEEIKSQLSNCGLKVTPQRIVILEALNELKNHPTAENIIEYIRKKHPNIATGTVYKVLETFVENKIINKVKTENDVMRYDAILSSHHHLYSKDSDRIEDYIDSELDDMLKQYFEKKNITHFKVEEIRLHIKGKFLTS